MHKLLKVSAMLLLLISNKSFASNLPEGWIQAGSNVTDYQVGIDQEHVYEGSQSAYIEGKDIPSNQFGTIMQMISAEEYKGKRMQLTGVVKAKDVNAWAGLWFRVDGENGKTLAFDNMTSRPISGTKDWKQYSIVLDVPRTATNLAFGLLLSSDGKVWLDGLELTEVDTSVAITDMYKKKTKRRPENLNFETK